MEAETLFRKADQLRRGLAARRDRSKSLDVLGDPESRAQLQELLNLCSSLLVDHTDFALSKEVETSILWNFCVRDTVARLRKQQQPQVSVMSTLGWFLESCSGFYLMLLGKLAPRDVHSAMGPHRHAAPIGSPDAYLLQHCLVHIGDIARYKNRMQQARVYYLNAIESAPTYGQAYNQLALLEVSKGNGGDRLSAVFYYIRSIAVDHPFPVAAPNLTKMFQMVLQSAEGVGPISSTEGLTAAFLRFHSMLHLANTDYVAAFELCGKLNDAMTTLSATGSMPELVLVKMVAIMIIGAEDKLAQVGKDPSQIQKTDLAVRGLMSELLAGFLNALLLPVYTSKQGDSLLEYFGLPAVKLLLAWIGSKPAILDEHGFSKRRHIWPTLCKMLNELQSIIVATKDDEEMERMRIKLAQGKFALLKEDQFLIGFRPLQEYLLKCRPLDDERETFSTLARALGVIQAGKDLAQLDGQRSPLNWNSCGTFEVAAQVGGGILKNGLGMEEGISARTVLDCDDSLESLCKNLSRMTSAKAGEDGQDETAALKQISGRGVHPDPGKKRLPNQRNVAMNAILKQCNSSAISPVSSKNFISAGVQLQLPHGQELAAASGPSNLEINPVFKLQETWHPMQPVFDYPPPIERPPPHANNLYPNQGIYSHPPPMVPFGIHDFPSNASQTPLTYNVTGAFAGQPSRLYPVSGEASEEYRLSRDQNDLKFDDISKSVIRSEQVFDVTGTTTKKASSTGRWDLAHSDRNHQTEAELPRNEDDRENHYSLFSNKGVWLGSSLFNSVWQQQQQQQQISSNSNESSNGNSSSSCSPLERVLFDQQQRKS